MFPILISDAASRRAIPEGEKPVSGQAQGAEGEDFFSEFAPQDGAPPSTPIPATKAESPAESTNVAVVQFVFSVPTEETQSAEEDLDVTLLEDASIAEDPLLHMNDDVAIEPNSRDGESASSEDVTKTLDTAVRLQAIRTVPENDEASPDEEIAHSSEAASSPAWTDRNPAKRGLPDAASLSGAAAEAQPTADGAETKIKQPQAKQSEVSGSTRVDDKMLPRSAEELQMVRSSEPASTQNKIMAPEMDDATPVKSSAASQDLSKEPVALKLSKLASEADSEAEPALRSTTEYDQASESPVVAGSARANHPDPNRPAPPFAQALHKDQGKADQPELRNTHPADIEQVTALQSAPKPAARAFVQASDQARFNVEQTDDAPEAAVQMPVLASMPQREERRPSSAMTTEGRSNARSGPEALVVDAPRQDITVTTTTNKLPVVRDTIRPQTISAGELQEVSFAEHLKAESSVIPTQISGPSSATPSQSTSVVAPHSPLGASVSAQVSVAIAEMDKGQIEISLSPEELGKVRLTLHSMDGSLTVGLHADRPETLDLMRRHVHMLARDLSDLGYESVAFDFGGTQSGQNSSFTESEQTETAEAEDGAVPDVARRSGPSERKISPLPMGPETGLDIRI